MKKGFMFMSTFLNKLPPICFPFLVTSLLIFFYSRTRDSTPCRVGRYVRPYVGHIFEFRAVFALQLLPNRPRLDCRVSGLVDNDAAQDCLSYTLFMSKLKSFKFSLKWRQEQISDSMRLIFMLE